MAGKGKSSGAGAWGKPDKEPVLEEDFPSIQQAAMMARGVKLNPRPPKNTDASEDVTPEGINISSLDLFLMLIFLEVNKDMS